ncbi:MAG TPA: DUF3035 domain-containing protein [Rhizomicrobium sp.]|jgi:uncharacterized lipoprotein
MKNAVRLAGAALLLAGLSGCDSVRDAMGTQKDSPDEFAVVTKAPLVMPPDFTLRPPKPGAPPTNQIAPTDVAQTAMFSGDSTAATAALPANMSQGEKTLLASAGATGADNSIRQVIAADNRNMQAADEGFTDNLMFWQKSQAAADPNVDAAAEANRLANQKPAQPAAAAPAPATAPAPAASAPAAPAPATPAPATQPAQKDSGAGNAN